MPFYLTYMTPMLISLLWRKAPSFLSVNLLVFHYDFFLLGITTFIAGLIGVPAPNGLIPQAPIHTTSLIVMGRPVKRADEEEAYNEKSQAFSNAVEVPVAIVEQRVSNLAQGALCLVLLTGPFLHILNLIPRGVLAGLL